jgi:dihydropteroate synthase
VSHFSPIIEPSHPMVPALTSSYRFGPVQHDLSARTHLMGILNVTPDSFSDGGKYYHLEDAVKRGLLMVEEGADFIDVGGESTRPGSEPIPLEEELRRTIPVIEKLARATDVPISIDTTKSAVASDALAAGAVIVNDVSGLRFDPGLADVVARNQASLVLMHMGGRPKTMQEHPEYDDVVAAIMESLGEGIRLARQRGVVQMLVDPGIGFGKSVAHNTEILRRLGELRSLGYPILIGPSRKSFIGKILDLPVDDRLEGTAAAVAAAIMNGANIIRVHDLKQMKRVAMTVDAIIRPSPPN